VKYFYNLKKKMFSVLLCLKFIPVMKKLNFLHPYFSLQCHMILQKLFEYAIIINGKKSLFFLLKL